MGRAQTAALTVMIGLPPRLAPPEMTDEQAFAALVGGWLLVRWTNFRSNGSRDHPFGRDAVGQIMYSADGHMSCHLMRADRANCGVFGSDQVDDAQLGRTMRSYSGYFGSFSVNAKEGLVTHHVAGASFPDWTGSDQPRQFAFADDRLFLEAAIGGNLVRIEWRRAG